MPLAFLAALLTFASLLIPMIALLATLSTPLPARHRPDLTVESRSPQALQRSPAREHTGGNNLVYGGGPVMAGTSHIYAIFWEPHGNVSPRYNSLITRYFREVGSSPLYRLVRQYTQTGGGYPAGSVLAGSWVDHRPYPANPLLDSDIQDEVTRAQQMNGWHSSMRTMFFVFTERNEDICTDSTRTQCASSQYCAYHSAFGSNTIYAALPYIASFACTPYAGPNGDDADKTITGISHEQLEAATDPLGNAWVDSDGDEVADKCAQDFGQIDAQGANVVWNGEPYLVQEEWDNYTGTCRLNPGAQSLEKHLVKTSELR